MKQKDLTKGLLSLIEEMRCEKHQQNRNGLAKAACKVVEDMENLTSDHKTSRGENISPQTPIEITKNYIPDWKPEGIYLTLKSEVNQGKLDDFREGWLELIKEVKEERVTDIEIATIYATYWDSKLDSQGNVFAKHSIKKEYLEEMKKKGETLDYKVDDIGIKVTKR